jgi:hypothetical protein
MDWPLDEDFEDTAPPKERADRQPVPEGHHDLKIHQVKLDADKLELTLVHPDKAYGWVFAGFPRDKTWARKIVAGLPVALGISADDWQRMEPGDLIDRKVRARVYHKPGREGRVFVNVGSFHAVEADDGPPPAEPAKKSRNAPPPAEDADDIPF